MHDFFEKVQRWLLPVLVILFAAGMITFPLAMEYAFAGRSEAPGHVLTYTRNKLQWDSATGIDANGAAILDIFDTEYPGVAASGDVVAPGTSGGNIVRLSNSSHGPVKYTAVLYRIRSSELLAVEAELSGVDFQNTDTYLLPTGVSRDQVVQAVTGTLGSNMIQDFDIGWNWAYSENALQDARDTLMGTLGDESVTVGLYIVVEDDNADADSTLPQTGDNSNVHMYSAMMLVSGVLLLFLAAERRREKECEEECAEG